jgi:hypothetical protein
LWGGCVGDWQNYRTIPTVENLRGGSFSFPPKPLFVFLLKISTMCSYKMRWYHLLRGEVHKKYVRQIIG